MGVVLTRRIASLIPFKITGLASEASQPLVGFTMVFQLPVKEVPFYGLHAEWTPHPPLGTPLRMKFQPPQPISLSAEEKALGFSSC